jgi:hypothetical protein
LIGFHDYKPSRVLEQRTESLFGALGLGEHLPQILRGFACAFFEFEKRTAILNLAIRNPGAIGLLTPARQAFIELTAIAATVQITAAVRTEAISLHHIGGQLASTIVASPHKGE